MASDMGVVAPGQGLIELIQNSKDRVVLAAPYIKSHALRRILNLIPDSVTEFLCITRWLPEDIASGVCDLEILDDVLSVHGGLLLVHPHLHAKYFSNGFESLVGSANLTARGLGWYTPSNIELLVSISASYPGLGAWEHSLVASAVKATPELRDNIRIQAAALREAGSFSNLPEVDEEAEIAETHRLWVPKCPSPDRLWQVYCGLGADTMVSSAFQAAQDDIEALAPPEAMTQDLFSAYIAGILKQMPLLVEIERLAASGLNDSKALLFLEEALDGDLQESDYHQIWRVIKNWLVYFFPETYRLETGQEVLVLGREVSRTK